MKKKGESEINKSMKGGQQKIVPLFNQEKNTPYLTNTQKDIQFQKQKKMYPENNNYDSNNQGMAQSGPINTNTKGLQPMVNLQVYQPQKPKEAPPSKDPSIYNWLPPTVQTYPQQYGPIVWNPARNQINIVKNYDISSGGPYDNPIRLNNVYEDMLPNKNISTISNSLSERLTLNNFIRTTMFPKGDGLNTDINGSENSILTRIKFMDINPYNTYKFSNNIYSGLPNGFLIYRSCYPIQHESNNSSVSCAKGASGINVRIYMLLNKEYNDYKNKNSVDGIEAFRDLIYYEYIKENIIKPKKCPNFVMLYGYNLLDKSGIDFNKIYKAKGLTLPDCLVQQVQPNIKNSYATNATLYGSLSKIDTGSIISGIPTSKTATTSTTITPTENPNDNKYMGQVLLLMTESPIYNLYAWCSKTYQTQGNRMVKTMINTGFYADKIWYSVLFQIMVSLYCLQIHGIAFNNYTVENNIYIKDLETQTGANTFWKYRINNVEYYIPNYGYLVLFDSNYADLSTDIKISGIKNPEKKIDGEIFEVKPSDIKKKTFEQFKKTFTANIFSRAFVDVGGVKPSDDVLNFLGRIEKEASMDINMDIAPYFIKFMSKFINNRVGTYLKVDEVVNVFKNSKKDFKTGDIVILEKPTNVYKFVLYVKPDSTVGSMIEILTKDKNENDLSIKQESLDLLYPYSMVESIIPNYKLGETFDEANLLETYIINSN